MDERDRREKEKRGEDIGEMRGTMFPRFKLVTVFSIIIIVYKLFDVYYTDCLNTNFNIPVRILKLTNTRALFVHTASNIFDKTEVSYYYMN